MQRGNRSRGGPRGGGGPKPPVEVGEELDVTIEAVGEKGDGIARKDGFVLFVPGVKEGDQVKVKVTKVLRKVGFAEVVEPEGAPAEEAPPGAPVEAEEEAPPAEASAEPAEAPEEMPEEVPKEAEKPADAPSEEPEEELPPPQPPEDSESFGEEEEK